MGRRASSSTAAAAIAEPMPPPVDRAQLLAATERLRALGIEDEVIFSGTADEVIAFLEATDPCAPSA
jgi:hypothetical protein